MAINLSISVLIVNLLIVQIACDITLDTSQARCKYSKTCDLSTKGQIDGNRLNILS